MVYSGGKLTSNINDIGGQGLLSSKDVMDILGVTKVTLYKWTMLKKIKVRRYQIGSRIYNGFDLDDVNKLKEKMVKNRKPGKPLIQG
jgi:hypothetical protein